MSGAVFAMIRRDGRSAIHNNWIFAIVTRCEARAGERSSPERCIVFTWTPPVKLFQHDGARIRSLSGRLAFATVARRSAEQAQSSCSSSCQLPVQDGQLSIAR